MTRYDLLLSGRCREDVPTDTLLASLMYHLKLTPEHAERLLPPATGTLKRGLPAEEAGSWLKRLTDTGLDVRLEARCEASPLAMDLRSRLAVLEAASLPRPTFGLGHRLQLLAAVATSLAIFCLYLLPGVSGALLALAGLQAFVALLQRDALIACTLVLPIASLGFWLGISFLSPLLRRKVDTGADLAVSPEEEPDVHALVDALCRAMQVRRPRRLVLTAKADIHLDARAQTLALGLPLMPALSAQQYLASLGHALGHQVYDLDRLGGPLIHASLAQLERLAQMPKTASHQRLYRFSSAWARWLSLLGRRLTRAATQRREARADHYEALLAGSEAFRETALRRQDARQAWRAARRHSLAAQRRQGLSGNLLELTEALLARQAELPRLSPRLTNRYWNRHPPDELRVAWVMALDVPALLTDPRPASALLAHYGAYSRALTRAVYRLAGDAEGDEPPASVAEAVPERAQDAGEELQRWSGHAWFDAPWLPLHQPLDRRTRALCPGAVRKRIQALAANTAQNWQEAEKEAQRRCLLAFHEEVHSHGLAQTVRGDGEFNQQHLLEFRAIDTWQTRAREQLRQVAPLYKRRIEQALARRFSGHEQARDCYRLLVALAELYPQVERLREARLLVKEYRTLQRRLPGAANIDALCDFAEQDYQHRVEFWLNSALPLPSSIASGNLGDHLQRHCPRLVLTRDSPSDVYRHTSSLLSALTDLHQRVWLHLARWCLHTEGDTATPSAPAPLRCSP